VFEESHRGHLNFSCAEGVELVAEVVVVVEDEGDGEGAP
jgi:hypothetical protein